MHDTAIIIGDMRVSSAGHRLAIDAEPITVRTPCREREPVNNPAYCGHTGQSSVSGTGAQIMSKWFPFLRQEIGRPDDDAYQN